MAKDSKMPKGKSDKMTPAQMKIAAKAGNKNKIEGKDFAAMRKAKKK
jgi:hypothetical protein